MARYQEEYNSERGNRWVAALLAVSLHVGVLFFLLFMVAWREPDPPLPEVGIELNFGTVDSGSGEIQPEPQETPVEPEPQQPETQPEPVQEVPASEPAKQVVTQPKENPVVAVKEKPEPPKEKPKVPEEKPAPKPVEKSTPKPEEKPKLVFNPDAKKSNEPRGNQGNDPGQSGDKGDPKGKVDENATYKGTPGGGNSGQGGSGTGTGLNLAGWKWNREPRPVLPENESNGKIVFEIEVDEDGKIIKLVTIERGISLAAEKKCREEIYSLKFIQTGPDVPPISSGRLTVVVTAR